MADIYDIYEIMMNFKDLTELTSSHQCEMHENEITHAISHIEMFVVNNHYNSLGLPQHHIDRLDKSNICRTLLDMISKKSLKNANNCPYKFSKELGNRYINALKRFVKYELTPLHEQLLCSEKGIVYKARNERIQCDHCDKQIRRKHISEHKRTKKCMSYGQPQEIKVKKNPCDKIECENCGCFYTRANKSIHIKSAKCKRNTVKS